MFACHTFCDYYILRMISKYRSLKKLFKFEKITTSVVFRFSFMLISFFNIKSKIDKKSTFSKYKHHFICGIVKVNSLKDAKVTVYYNEVVNDRLAQSDVHTITDNMFHCCSTIDSLLCCRFVPRINQRAYRDSFLVIARRRADNGEWKPAFHLIHH